MTTNQLNKLFCKHKYDIFLEQHIINSGMDKLIYRKCSKCGKITCGNIDYWFKKENDYAICIK